MANLIDGTKNLSSESILNWILLLCIFSIITVIGNYAGYEQPISDSLILSISFDKAFNLI